MGYELPESEQKELFTDIQCDREKSKKVSVGVLTYNYEHTGNFLAKALHGQLFLSMQQVGGMSMDDGEDTLTIPSYTQKFKNLLSEKKQQHSLALATVQQECKKKIIQVSTLAFLGGVGGTLLYVRLRGK